MKKTFFILLFVSLFVCLPVLAADTEVVKLENPLTITTDNPAQLIGYIIRAVLAVVGGVALVMMIYGGFQWLTAAGSEDKIKSGTQTMLWSAIGLVLVFSSYILVQTVLNFVYGRTA